MRLLPSLAALMLAVPSAGAQAVSGLSGTLVITNKAPSTATLVDVASNRILATLPTGNGPHEVVVSRDGRTAVVTDYGAQVPGNSLTVIDVPGRTVARTISLGEYRRPHGIVMLPGDSLVAVTSETNRAVILVHVARGEVVRVVPTEKNGSHMVGVTADGTRGWTGDIGSNTVTELDLVRGVPLRHIAVPAQPEAINVTSDGREVWVGSNATGTVSVVDATSGAVSTAADGLGWPYRVLFSARDSLVLVPDYRGEAVRVIDRATRRELGRVPLTGEGPQGITWAADGRHAFVSLSSAAAIAVIDVTTRRVVGRLVAGETPDGVAYAPGGAAR